ncbi:hypothetical protein FT643_22950 [Ketobacter sp. MCCC 1A13808]|uniref:hypothetical protein n=1 Tax=Ketobacter sp. MCCC 1A13808 TaxID=2602738 RepID=UPI0012EB172E|nr:hypothetical protein [Ketobacter sp. MCCC 1A13808]MVF14986.1 hypothetical protein [Ketobacter sp. MCCC 1A13808]
MSDLEEIVDNIDIDDEEKLKQEFIVAEAEEKKFRKIFQSRYYIPLIISIWAVGGCIPIIVYSVNEVLVAKNLGVIDVNFEGLSHISNVFGAANALFTGGALIMAVLALSAQIRELHLMRMEHRMTRIEHKMMRNEHEKLVEATKEQAKLEASALAANVTMPIFLKTRSVEVRDALKEISFQWRKTEHLVLGEKSGTLIKRHKEDPTNQGILEEIELVQERLVERLTELSSLVTQDKATKEQTEEFKTWDGARGQISIIAQQVYQLFQSGVVTDKAVLKISAFDNFVATYKYYVYPIEFLYEKRRNPSAEDYPPGKLFMSLYDSTELTAAMY